MNCVAKLFVRNCSIVVEVLSGAMIAAAVVFVGAIFGLDDERVYVVGE